MMAAAACLCLVITRTLIQNNPDARLADVASPTAVLASWIAGRWLAGPPNRERRGLGIALRRCSLVLVAALTLWSVATQAEFMDVVKRAHLLEGSSAIQDQLAEVSRRLTGRPIDGWETTDEHRGLLTLGRYVARCTAPTDRLLVAGFFAPEAYFYTGRAFAGGQVHFMWGWHDSPADQQLTVERLRHQSIPIVLLGLNEKTFVRRFSAVSEHVNTTYQQVAASTFGGNEPWRVLVDPRRQPVGMDPELGLPCYYAPLEE